MKIKTQVIDKIEDVQGDDIVVFNGSNHVLNHAVEPGTLDVDNGRWLTFNDCTVVRLTLEEE